MYIKSASPNSLSSLDSQFGWKAPDSEVDLRDMIQEVQGLRLSMCDGGSQSALLQVRGSGGVSKTAKLSTSDTIVGALATVGKGGTSGIASFSMRDDVRIAATAGSISISGGATTGQQILLLWFDKTGYSAY